MLSQTFVGVGMSLLWGYWFRLTTYADTKSSSESMNLETFIFLLKSPLGPYVILLLLFLIGLIIWSNYRKLTLWKIHPSFSQMMREIKITNEFKKKDPHFSSDNFKSYASEVFVELQDTWKNLNETSLRVFELNELFQRHTTQFKAYIQKGWHPRLMDS